MAVRNIVLGRAKSRLNKLSTRLVIVGQLATILRIGFLFLKNLYPNSVILTYSYFYADVASKEKFAEATCAACKGKVIVAGTFASPSRRSHPWRSTPLTPFL